MLHAQNPVSVNFDLRNGIAVLERTPRVLEALLSGLPEAWTTGNEGADTWSPFDVVGHLIDGELADWMARLDIILQQGPNRRFEPFDRFRHISRNKRRTLNDLLAEFLQLREKNLAALRALELTAAQLQLTGEHPAFGSVTLQQLLATWVRMISGTSRRSHASWRSNIAMRSDRGRPPCPFSTVDVNTVH